MFDKVIIVDRSVSSETESTIDTGLPTAFFPVFSKKGYGRDSTVKFFSGSTQANLVSRYGNPDIDTYLAPMYYAHQFLAGNGNAYIRRIVSTTSTAAHAILVAKGRVTEAEVFEVKFEIQTIEAMTSFDALVAAAEALYSAIADIDGYKTYPIALLSLLWSGVEGNKYTFRLLQNASLEKQIDQRGYSIAITPNASSEATTIEFSSSSTAILDNTSIYANDIFEANYPDASFVFLNTFKTFLTDIATYIPSTETEPDIFFGKLKEDGSIYPNYSIIDTSVDFTAIGGIALADGSDGGFDITSSTRVDNMMTQYVSSFAEEETLILTNEYKYYIDYVYDFGAPSTVKTALVSFVNARMTTQAILDIGTIATTTKTAILAARKTGDSSWNNKSVTVVAGVAGYVDPFTTKKITMPGSFFEAFAVPNHINTQDRGSYPFAGDRFQYANMIPGTYLPRFYSESDSVLESFVDNKINVAFEDSQGYVAYIQSTSLKTISDLAERNNVFLLHKLIRISLLTAKAERWNFAEDSDIAKYADKLNKNIDFGMNGLFGSFVLTAEREGKVGNSKNRVLVTAQIRFKYINKGTTFKFVVIGSDTIAA